MCAQYAATRTGPGAVGMVTTEQQATLKDHVTTQTVAFGTMCSGSGMAEIVHDFLLRAIGKSSSRQFSGDVPNQLPPWYV